MSPWFWTLFYGVLTTSVAIPAWRRSEDTRAASAVLGLGWIVTNLSYYLMPQPNGALFPFLDLVCLWALGIVWRDRLSGWRLVLLLLFLTQIAWHVRFFESGDASDGAAWFYDLILNILYVAQLGCVITGTRRPSNVIASQGSVPDGPAK